MLSFNLDRGKKIVYLHGKVPGHELTDGLQSSESRSDSETAETGLGNGGINDTLGAELVQESLGDL